MAGTVFGLTEELKAPKRPRRNNRLWRILVAVGVAGYVLSRLVSMGAKGTITIGVFAGVVLLLVLLLLAPAFIVSGRRSGKGGVRWKGMVSFHEDDVDDPSIFPQLTRTKRYGVGRQDLSGGRLEICDDGLRWKAGSAYTPRCEISGTFFLPWSEIHSVDVSYIPYKSNALGGSITLTVGSPARDVSGEFLGRKSPLTGALEDMRARLSGQPAQFGT